MVRQGINPPPSFSEPFLPLLFFLSPPRRRRTLFNRYLPFVGIFACHVLTCQYQKCLALLVCRSSLVFPGTSLYSEAYDIPMTTRREFICSGVCCALSRRLGLARLLVGLVSCCSDIKTYHITTSCATTDFVVTSAQTSGGSHLHKKIIRCLT